MFPNVCVFFLLGSTLVLANPFKDNGENELVIRSLKARSVFQTINSWLKKADKAIVNVYDRVTAPFKKLVRLLIETGEGVMDFSKEKLEQLIVKYYEIKNASEENLNKAKNDFILKVIDRLQNVIDVLSKQTDAETFEKLKKKTQEIASSSKEALEILQQQLQEAIEAEKKKLEENLAQWQEQADKAFKKNGSA